MTFQIGYVPWNRGKHTGLIPWNKGKTLSEETRQKLSENNGRYWLGKKFSAKHRKHISLAKKGKPSPLKGRKRPYTTIEHRRHLSIATAAYWKKHYHERKAQVGRKRNHGN